MTVQLSNGYKLQKLGSTSASLPNVTSAWIKSSGSKSFSSGAVLGSNGSEITRSAQSHAFKKLKTPARCKECDSYLYFYGLECHECGLTVHKKCLAELNIFCPHKRLQKKPTFGSHLWSQAQPACDSIPSIVAKCVAEIDQRGRKIKGLYRVSGVKSRVEKLCSTFEHGADLVDLSDVHPNIIANVLKLYLRQLPEPLMTHRLYPEFIRVAKQFPAPSCHHNNSSGNDAAHCLHADSENNQSDTESTLSSIELQEIHQLVNLVSRLPKINYLTLAYIMHHLKRVSDKSSENSMTSSNLGIVFGPTLMTANEGGSSLTSLVDTVHHTRVIDLLITYAHQVFGSPLKVDPTGRILGFADPCDLDPSDSDEDEDNEEDDEENDVNLQNRELIHQFLSKSPLSPPPMFTDANFPALSRSGKSMEFLSMQQHQQAHPLQQVYHQRTIRESPVSSDRSRCLWDDPVNDSKRYNNSSSVITLAGQKVIVSSISRPSPNSSIGSPSPVSSNCLRSLSPVKSVSTSAVPLIWNNAAPDHESNHSPSIGSSGYVTGSYTTSGALPVAKTRSLRPSAPNLLSPSQSYASSSSPTSCTPQSSLGSNISSSQSTLGSNSSDQNHTAHHHHHQQYFAPPAQDQPQHPRQHPTQQQALRQPSPSPAPRRQQQNQQQNHMITKSSTTKESINELRRQFFTGENNNELDRKSVTNILVRDASEDGSEAELVIARLTASANHAKLKRAATGSHWNRKNQQPVGHAMTPTGRYASHTIHYPSKCIRIPTRVHWDTRASDDCNQRGEMGIMSDPPSPDREISFPFSNNRSNNNNNNRHHHDNDESMRSMMQQYLQQPMLDSSLSRSKSANSPFSPNPQSMRRPKFV